MASSTMEDLRRERSRASFDVQELKVLLEGGPDRSAKRNKIQQLVCNDPVLSSENIYFMSRPEQYEHGLHRSLRAIQLSREMKFHEDPEAQALFYLACNSEQLSMNIHRIMFRPGFMGQATEEQLKKWLPLIDNYRIIGTYAQTELGHGTFIRGLETTASYDAERQEFILNTPTLTATKWWPGGLGKTCTHALVMANLKVRGQECGPHLFLVQLRSLENHMPCPGITVGDIGPKFGYETVDNGFLRLDNVRIPREQMMMRHAEVTPDGHFSLRGHSSKLTYGTMLFVRAYMVIGAGMSLSKALTIAVRYSAVRRQGHIDPKQPEVQVLDYGAQQYRLLPLIGLAHALMGAGHWLIAIHTTTSPSNPEDLQELHAASSCLKATASAITAQSIETCRLCCGGHGYSQLSGLPRIFSWATAAQTYEGENAVMWLQGARYLIKGVAKARKGSPLPAGIQYLGNWLRTSDHSPVIADGRQLQDVKTLVKAFECCSARQLASAERQLGMFMSKGADMATAWNQCNPWLLSAAKQHSEFLLIYHYARSLKQEMSGTLRTVLQRLFTLYALWRIEQCSGNFLETGTLTAEALGAVHIEVSKLLTALRPEAVALVDGFNHHDKSLHSALGCYDGDVYRRLFEGAKKAPLNQKEVTDGYYKYIRPLLRAKL